MDLHELIRVIPELLLLVVPGYIAVRLRERYRLEKKSESFDVILCSILYSFIIGIVYTLLEEVTARFAPQLAVLLAEETVKQALCLLLAVFLGLCLVKFPESGVGARVRKLFNPDLSPEPSVWIKAMQNEAGVWATVYLKNGLIYTGMLADYTADFNEEKELLLLQYRLSVRREGTPTTPQEFCIDIEDRTSDPGARVYLRCQDVISIEIRR